MKPEYLHPKSRCEVLAGEEDFSNDVVTLGTCISMFVYIRVLFHFALTDESTGIHREIGGGIQMPEAKLQALLPFPAPPPERPGVLASQAWTNQM